MHDRLTLEDARTAFLLHRPATPTLLWSQAALEARARVFLDHWPGLVTYAVKANPMEEVVTTLRDAGVTGWDVASGFEIDLMGRLDADGARHYHNPVRTKAEIAHAAAAGVRTYSVDSASELAKLDGVVPAGSEISVRFRLPVDGAVYNFGSKFGADPEAAVELLQDAERRGFQASLAFHPGTQCADVGPWHAYLTQAHAISQEAGVRPLRVNVGGGFPSHRTGASAPNLAAWCRSIGEVHADLWGEDAPPLVCEPGRAMVADAFVLAVGVKAIRNGAMVFLDDGVYGALAETPTIGMPGRILAMAPDGTVRTGAPIARPVFGPTCDSVDRLPEGWALPDDIEEGDVLLLASMGAYSTVTNTRFNGFGALSVLKV
jgi:ornithine decarboxylase